MSDVNARVHGVPGRYATALYELAEEAGLLESVEADLHALRAMLAESADLARVIRSPIVSREDQASALAAVGERAGFTRLTVRFLGLMASNRRLFALRDAIDAFDALRDQGLGRTRAEVVSAQALDDEQERALRDALAVAVGGEVALRVSEDPSLIGGVVVRLGSRMIDATLRSRLDRMRLAMREVS